MLRSIIILFLTGLIGQISYAGVQKNDSDLHIVTLRGSCHEANIIPDSLESGNTVLDFTSFPRKGDATAQYIMSGDSQAMELMPDVRFDFVRSDNGLPTLVCIEGRTWKATVDSLPVNGCSQRIDSCSLSLDLSLTLNIKGHSTQKLEPDHALITPLADTIHSVSLLAISFDGEITRQSAPDRCRPIKAQRLYWVRPGADYPTAVATTLNGSIVSLYYFDSVETSAGDDRQLIANIDPKPLFPTAIAHSLAQPGLPDKPKEFSPDNISDRASAPSITIDRGTITVTIPDANPNTSFNILLCDLLGRTIPVTTGSPTRHIFQNLLPGDYILTISSPNSSTSHKIHVH